MRSKGSRPGADGSALAIIYRSSKFLREIMITARSTRAQAQGLRPILTVFCFSLNTGRSSLVYNGSNIGRKAVRGLQARSFCNINYACSDPFTRISGQVANAGTIERGTGRHADFHRKWIGKWKTVLVLPSSIDLDKCSTWDLPGTRTPSPDRPMPPAEHRTHPSREGRGRRCSLDAGLHVKFEDRELSNIQRGTTEGWVKTGRRHTCCPRIIFGLVEFVKLIAQFAMSGCKGGFQSRIDVLRELLDNVLVVDINSRGVENNSHVSRKHSQRVSHGVVKLVRPHFAVRAV
ncbi:hypothetical protein GGX14DRAFT_396786 [Mycena pura]|uniref:Uncharacterized protein n=1 Tax=Mycena pura TaxID=153505 RepID=A0AAD6YFB7_9AGAR|nr:hypothetical protein GGX14DRAFT_396786 [Mycena pura]